MRAALDSPDRDALFTRVETAVRALKADAEAQPAEDFADLRSDLRAAPEADGDTMTLILDPGQTATAAEEADLGVDARTDEGMTPQAAAADDDARGEDAPEDASGDEASSASPPVSEEGVIAAYTVGDVSYTMFADGRIRSDSPEGERMFASMDELKEHMARRRLGA